MDLMEGIQNTETIKIGAVLALAGGFMDAYSYICRGKVFANAQTGNILLLGVSVSSGDWETALLYSAPIIAFVVGIVLAELIRQLLEKKSTVGKLNVHWRQISVFVEMLFLASVCFIPQNLNLLANSLISLACGMQVESFRNIRGNSIATTMCIGNLRSGTEYLYLFVRNRDKEARNRMFLYFGIIVCFVLGAVIGNVMIGLLQEMAMLVCSGILLIAFIMMIDKN